MKIVGKKGSDVRKILAQVQDLLEKIGGEYPQLAADLQLKLDLQDADGTPCPQNDAEFCFAGKETANLQQTALEDIYNCDALTGLYNRGRYERDLATLEAAGCKLLSAVYIDAVGLHEINNHLGHQAGDEMLRCVAAGIRQVFPGQLAYRIGGDEYVVLCIGLAEPQAEVRLAELRDYVRRNEHEISTGAAQGSTGKGVQATVNEAEQRMRHNKTEFYAQNGAERQMRTLNHKLEALLLEKQDASKFLNVIAPRYLGVYMVNAKKDSCRYIYIPKYFQKALEEHAGRFSPAIREYCDVFVCAADQAQFRTIIDYDYVRSELLAGRVIDFAYRKKDGARVRLKITIYDRNSPENEEMQWIFVDDNE